MPSPPPEEAAPLPVEVQPVVDPAVVTKLAELQASYDQTVAIGHSCLEAGNIKGARVCESDARLMIKDSKQLQVVAPIGPGPVRKLKREIDERVEAAQRDAEQQRNSLKAYAREKLQAIRETAGIKVMPFTKVILYSGDVHRALELIRCTDPGVVDVLSEEYRTLETELVEAVELRDQLAADRCLRSIQDAMYVDSDRALDLLHSFPAELASYVELNGMEEEIEQHREAAEKLKRVREERELEGSASELYEHIMGYRKNPVKPRDSAERLREAERDQPELLKAAARCGLGTEVQGMRDEIEQRRKHARGIWEGFQELEYLEEAKNSSQELIRRLIAVAHRGLLEQIMNHRGYYAKRDVLVSDEHRTAIRGRIDELKESDCPDCWKLAIFLLTFSELKEPERRDRNGGYGNDDYIMSYDEMFCDWDGQARTDFVWSWDARNYGEHLINELSAKLRGTTGITSCGKHAPKQASWQKQTKQSRRNANAQTR